MLVENKGPERMDLKNDFIILKLETCTLLVALVCHFLFILQRVLIWCLSNLYVIHS